MPLYLRTCVTFSTGFLPLNAFAIELLHSYGGAFLVLLHLPYLTFVGLSLTFWPVALSALQLQESSWFRDLALLSDSIGLSPLWVPPFGMVSLWPCA